MSKSFEPQRGGKQSATPLLRPCFTHHHHHTSPIRRALTPPRADSRRWPTAFCRCSSSCPSESCARIGPATCVEEATPSRKLARQPLPRPSSRLEKQPSEPPPLAAAHISSPIPRHPDTTAVACCQRHCLCHAAGCVESRAASNSPPGQRGRCPWPSATFEPPIDGHDPSGHRYCHSGSSPT